MPDTDPILETDAEQTALCVIKRWKKITNRFGVLLAVSFYLFFFSVALPIRRHESLLATIIITLIYLLVFTLLCLSLKRGHISLAKELSEDEKNALRGLLCEDGTNTADTIKEILKYSRQTAPAKEYVRASSAPEQPDTLLRAAQPSTETTQEQLLRPAQE